MNVSLTKNTQTNENKTNFNNNEKHIANTIQNNNKIKKHSKQHKTKINVSLTKKTHINRTQKTTVKKHMANTTEQHKTNYSRTQHNGQVRGGRVPSFDFYFCNNRKIKINLKDHVEIDLNRRHQEHLLIQLVVCSIVSFYVYLTSV